MLVSITSPLYGTKEHSIMYNCTCIEKQRSKHYFYVLSGFLTTTTQSLRAEQKRPYQLVWTPPAQSTRNFRPSKSHQHTSAAGHSYCIPYKYRTVRYLYHIVPDSTVPCHTILYRTLPYRTIPYHTIMFHTMP